MRLRPLPQAGFTARPMNGGRSAIFAIAARRRSWSIARNGRRTCRETNGDHAHYEKVLKTLARSECGEDRQLAVDLVRYLGARGRTPEIERDRGRTVNDEMI